MTTNKQGDEMDYQAIAAYQSEMARADYRRAVRDGVEPTRFLTITALMAQGLSERDAHMARARYEASTGRGF